jgi:hypothetical protein
MKWNEPRYVPIAGRGRQLRGVTFMSRTISVAGPGARGRPSRFRHGPSQTRSGLLSAAMAAGESGAETVAIGAEFSPVPHVSPWLQSVRSVT